MGDFAEAVQLGGKEKTVIWSLKREQGRGAAFWKKLIELHGKNNSVLLTFLHILLFLFMWEQQNLTSFFYLRWSVALLGVL